MSPRHFWNHPLQELARSLSQTLRPGAEAPITRDEFTAFLGRLVGTTAQGPGPLAQPARSVVRRPPVGHEDPIA